MAKWKIDGEQNFNNISCISVPNGFFVFRCKVTQIIKNQLKLLFFISFFIWGHLGIYVVLAK